jgi:hypothetical protein
LPTLATGKELSDIFGQAWLDLKAGESAVIAKTFSENLIYTFSG